MKRILMSSSVLAVIGGAAFAGGYTAPAAEPVVMAAPVAVMPTADWGGFYAGAQLGYGDANDAVDDGGVVGGVHGGYLYDFGKYVAGGELAFSGADITDNTQNSKIDSFTDLKFIGGVKQNNWLFYGGLGASYIKGDTAGGVSASDTVPMATLGVRYKVRPNMTVGGAVDYRKGDDFDGSGQDLDLTTVSLTTSFQF
ncbi:outer membrane beta-barrel protein [Thioclava sp.]|uniref:outer membrane beta-barrel protein n=1 Tax=Thioclava sp. TaxID=1933450 RepID=UPI003AA896A1